MTGFCVPFAVKKTPSKGLGVFVTAPVERGATVWRFVPGQYKVYDETSFCAAIEGRSDTDIVYELNHAFGFSDFPDHVIRIHDGGELINHASDANVATKCTLMRPAPPAAAGALSVQDVTGALLDDRYAQVALRDIASGEELTNNYGNEIGDPPFYLALCERYDVNDDYLDDK